MVEKSERIAIKADPNDPEDFDVTDEALEKALADRRERRRLRGAQAAPTKKMVSIRLDVDVLARWRDSGPGWQSRANEALRKAAP